MTTETTEYDRGEELVLSTKKKEDRRVALGTLVGTAVEWYDFFIYANAAAITIFAAVLCWRKSVMQRFHSSRLPFCDIASNKCR